MRCKAGKKIKKRKDFQTMKMEMQIEFHKIKEQWASLALTESAKEKIENASYFLSESEVRKEIRDTTDSRNLMEKLGLPPFQNVTEIKEILTAAEKGDCLTPDQLEQTEKAIASFRRLKDYLKRGKQYGNSLAYYEENMGDPKELCGEICRQIRNGAVDDYASGELLQIRKQILKYEEQMKQKAEQVMRTNKSYMTDMYCTFRNGRICVPVKKEYRQKIAGSVIDKSSTGSTLFIEPSQAAKCFDELQLLKISEENEIYRILYTLTALVAESAGVIEENIRMMEKLDFIFSKGKLSMEMNAAEPSVNTQRRIVLKDARHPLMDSSVNVPLQFSIEDKIRGIVITGPNTGGKTVAIKTVMLSCLMAQCGLHVTCKEADVCMNSSYLCDIGDGQNLSENLSTFSAHMKNVLQVLREANDESLVILDELGSGTDPAEGMGIAVSVLEELRRSGAIFLVTTHYPEIKEYAKKTDGILNARMTFEKETLQPTYRLVIGEAGESCAFYIADKLGMPNEMLKTAIRAAYGEEAVGRYSFLTKNAELEKTYRRKILKTKKPHTTASQKEAFRIGDCVLVYPEKKIGIVCGPVNEKGVLRVQLPGKKIWINQKRVKLHVAAEKLYPDDYDFSILFETVEHRKIRHDMERKYTEQEIFCEET